MDLTTININKYRIKTREEFKNEFGRHWRQELSWPFLEKMNYLLGRKLSDFKIIHKDKEIIIRDFENETWVINKDMIKKNINKKERIQWI